MACVIGDGEAETGPLAAASHSTKFVNPAGDGTVLPILHLNGYKIADPSVLSRIGREELTRLLEGYGHRPWFVEGDDRSRCTGNLPPPLTRSSRRSAVHPGRRQRPRPLPTRPRRPALVLVTPKGWTRPAVVDGLPMEGTWRAHQIPLRPRSAPTPSTCAGSRNGRAATGPKSSSTAQGRPRPEITASAPEGARRMGTSPYANGACAQHESSTCPPSALRRRGGEPR